MAGAQRGCGVRFHRASQAVGSPLDSLERGVWGGQGRFLSRETRYGSCMELDWRGKEKKPKPPAVVPGGNEHTVSPQTQLKDLTHRNADGLDVGCEGKELGNS